MLAYQLDFVWDVLLSPAAISITACCIGQLLYELPHTRVLQPKGQQTLMPRESLFLPDMQFCPGLLKICPALYAHTFAGDPVIKKVACLMIR